MVKYGLHTPLSFQRENFSKYTVYVDFSQRSTVKQNDHSDKKELEYRGDNPIFSILCQVIFLSVSNTLILLLSQLCHDHSNVARYYKRGKNNSPEHFKSTLSIFTYSYVVTVGSDCIKHAKNMKYNITYHIVYNLAIRIYLSVVCAWSKMRSSIASS